MNTKRQTIWLVSMLSLMVILSAYYLFTDNVDEVNTVSDNQEDGQITTVIDVAQDEHTDVIDESNGLVDDITEATLIDEIGESDVGLDQLAVETGQQVVSVSDNQIIENIEAGARNGEDYLAALEIKRNDTLAKDTQRLMDIISDPKKSNEEMAKAQEEFDHIEDMQYKISDLEDQLMQDFENVVITEEKGKWKAVVQADKLERSQAVTIMDMMITNLDITPSRIAGVQFVQ